MRSITKEDRKSTRLNSSHTEIYTLSLHDALPIFRGYGAHDALGCWRHFHQADAGNALKLTAHALHNQGRSEEHTSELQSHRDLHSFPTRRSSDLPWLWST